MTETIYLKIDRYGVRGMTKNLPSLRKGEYVVKVNVEVKSEAFQEPILTQDIVITDWRQGLAFPDLDLKEMAITQAEADKIVSQRKADVVANLRLEGYQITEPTNE